MGNRVLCCLQTHGHAKVDLTKSYKKFSLEGQLCFAFCTRVIDGDTAVFNVQTIYGVFEYPVRFAHLDSPELHSTEPTVKQHALACAALVKKLIEHKHCILLCGKFEKFGRLLASIYLPVHITQNNMQAQSATIKHSVPDQKDLEGLICFNTVLLKHTPCAPYEGRTKAKFHFDSTLVKYHPTYREIFEQLQ